MEDASNGIEVESLVRVFKGDVRAVDGIDLRVAPGEIYGFLGPNGAGKSTTVLVLTTLLPPTSGSARVAGLDVVHQGAEVRRAIGASLQESALDPFLTGREHMRLQSALHGLPKGEREASAAASCSRAWAYRSRGSQGGWLLGRDEAPPGSRARRCSTAQDCCSSTSPPPALTRRAGPPYGTR